MHCSNWSASSCYRATTTGLSLLGGLHAHAQDDYPEILGATLSIVTFDNVGKISIFSWEPALWTLMSMDRVMRRSKKIIAIFTYNHWFLSLDMKTKVVQHAPRINLSYFKFQIFKFSNFFKFFLVPSFCLTFRHFLVGNSVSNTPESTWLFVFWPNGSDGTKFGRCFFIGQFREELTILTFSPKFQTYLTYF